jgi:hypothetical protein
VRIGRDTPAPTQIISNEEYEPLPQTEAQREVQHRTPRLSELCDTGRTMQHSAKRDFPNFRHGWMRR